MLGPQHPQDKIMKMKHNQMQERRNPEQMLVMGGWNWRLDSQNALRLYALRALLNKMHSTHRVIMQSMH